MKIPLWPRRAPSSKLSSLFGFEVREMSVVAFGLLGLQGDSPSLGSIDTGSRVQSLLLFAEEDPPPKKKKTKREMVIPMLP